MRKSTRKQYFNKLYPYLKKGKKQYIELGILKVFFLLLSLVPQIFYFILINNVMIERKISLLWVVIVGYVGIYLLQTLGTVFIKMVYNKLFLKYNLAIKNRMLETYSKIETKEYESYSVGELRTRIDDDVSATERFFNQHVLDYIYAISSALIISVILLFLNPLLALVGFVMVPVSFWFTKFMGKKVYKLNEERRIIRGRYESFTFSCFANWKEIKANNLEEKHQEIFNEYRKELNPLFVKNQVFWYINRAFIAFKDFFITRMNLYFIGGLLIIAGQMDVGILLIFMNYYAQFFTNISQITDSNLQLNNDTPSLERVLEIFNKEITIKPVIKNLSGNIFMENVSFKYYDEQEMVLKNINLDISPHEHIAIVGRSGCGKTTLAKILMGLYPPQIGKVHFGEYDTNEIAFESVGNKIGIVPQDPPMFNLTIRENLEFARKNATYDEYINACKKVNIFDFIERLPGKFNTIIGEQGIKLSGGQKQRLSIARTILKNPDIIIFDEATSSLDSENEKAIVSSIKEISRGKTVITIAHRLSTILSCDRVVVIDKGEIIAIGKHEDLKGNNKIYDLLFEKQYVR